MFRVIILAVAMSFFAQAASAKTKVTLMIYVDLSMSMGGYRKVLADMAESITKDLEIQCGEFDAVVSNIRYKDKNLAGGEIIAPDNEPLFITETTPNGKELLKNRIKYDSHLGSFTGGKTYQFGTKEKTYSSVLETAPLHMMSSPRALKKSAAVCILMLTNAAPVFESVDPFEAAASLPKLFQGVPTIVGSLGATETCMDTPASATKQDLSKLGWLADFSKATGGYHWDICSANQEEKIQKIESAVRDFIIMLMELGQCRVIV